MQKRRIYDITNVLEGIGLIHKGGKNLIQWNSDSVCSVDPQDSNIQNEPLGSRNEHDLISSDLRKRYESSKEVYH